MLMTSGELGFFPKLTEAKRSQTNELKSQK